LCIFENTASFWGLLVEHDRHMGTKFTAKPGSVACAPNPSEAFPRRFVLVNDGSAEDLFKAALANETSATVDGNDAVEWCDTNDGISGRGEAAPAKQINGARSNHGTLTLTRQRWFANPYWVWTSATGTKLTQAVALIKVCC
jgi:hypothetical protein